MTKIIFNFPQFHVQTKNFLSSAFFPSLSRHQIIFRSFSSLDLHKYFQSRWTGRKKVFLAVLSKTAFFCLLAWNINFSFLVPVLRERSGREMTFVSFSLHNAAFKRRLSGNFHFSRTSIFATARCGRIGWSLRTKNNFYCYPWNRSRKNEENEESTVKIRQLAKLFSHSVRWQTISYDMTAYKV